MTDRILSRCLWLVIMCLITTSAVSGLLLVYSGLFKLISGRFQPGGISLSLGFLLAGGCWALCRHCDDLIDRTR